MNKLSAALFAGLFCLSAQACTIWASIGDSVTEGGDALIAKVRDYEPTEQEYKVVDDGHGYAYRGLISYGNRFRMAVNEKHLFVAYAMASCIPTEQLYAQKAYKSPEGWGVLETLTRRCADVGEALRLLPTLGHKQAIHILLADRDRIALIEVMPGGAMNVESTSRGSLYHTNHFVKENSRTFNVKVAKSSASRYARIGELLEKTRKPMTLDDFIAFSKDRHAGPNNSIFRVGKNYLSSRTVSVMIARIPKLGPVELYMNYQKNPDLEDDPWIETRELFEFPRH